MFLNTKLVLIYMFFIFRIKFIMRNYKKIEISEGDDVQDIILVNFNCIS